MFAVGADIRAGGCLQLVQTSELVDACSWCRHPSWWMCAVGAYIRAGDSLSFKQLTSS
jgi:hypothetical protein